MSRILLMPCFALIVSGCQTIKVITNDLATEVQHKDYEVQGNFTQELHFDLQESEKGPKDSSGHRGAAMTNCSVTFEVRGDNRSFSQNGMCQCTTRATHLLLEPKIEMTMPKWDRYETTSQACRDEWDRFYDALLFHEEGHVEICRDGLKKIQEKLIAISDREAWEIDYDCKSACKKTWGKISGELKKVYRKHFDEMRVIQDEYDKDTRHGINQGTHLTPCK